MKLIDADVLYQQFMDKMSELVASTNTENISEQALSLLCGAYLIKNAPRAVTLRHGKWLKLFGPDEDNNVQYVCSICSAGDVSAANQNVPYCWHCGAEMEDKVNDGNE